MRIANPESGGYGNRAHTIRTFSRRSVIARHRTTNIRPAGSPLVQYAGARRCDDEPMNIVEAALAAALLLAGAAVTLLAGYLALLTAAAFAHRRRPPRLAPGATHVAVVVPAH